jgi:regulation of enolase protein 1 (concanavalin A-like superfamily)
MTQPSTVHLPGLPTPLHWQAAPISWEITLDTTLVIQAGAQTDWFIDPETNKTTLNAPALLMPVTEPCRLRALVEADHAATFDAGVLVVHHVQDAWAKLCLEISPAGQVMVVSVVTRGTSDDCNALPVPGHAAHLRVSKLERAYAFHYSPDGNRWDLIRYFTLGDSAAAAIGFLAQSPTGLGCTARFRQIVYEGGKLAQLRSGE